jgi:hypothetical protein
MTDSAFGKTDFAFGPGKLYWDTETGGENMDLGGTDQIKITMSTKKIELKESQAGDRPADRAVSAQVVQISCGLARATLERLEQVVQGFHLETNTAGTVTRIWGSDVIGQRDSAILKQLTFVEIIDGVESTDPFCIIDFWKAAPMTESTELVFDATTQRYYGVMFECYKDDTKVDDEGRSTYWASREQVA